MKRIPLAEVVGVGIEGIVGEVPLCPVEIRLGEIEGGCLGTCHRRGYREGTGVSEGVEQAETRCHQPADLRAVVALVQKDSL